MYEIILTLNKFEIVVLDKVSVFSEIFYLMSKRKQPRPEIKITEREKKKFRISILLYN